MSACKRSSSPGRNPLPEGRGEDFREHRFAATAPFGKQTLSRRLTHHFGQKHARYDRKARKVIREVVVVWVDPASGVNLPAGIERDNAVYEEESHGALSMLVGYAFVKAPFWRRMPSMSPTLCIASMSASER